MKNYFKIKEGSKPFSFVEDGHEEIKEYIRQGDIITLDDSIDFNVTIQNSNGVLTYTLSEESYTRLLSEMNRCLSISNGEMTVFKY